MKHAEALLAVIFSLAFLVSAIAVPAPARGSITFLELVPGKYTGTNIYVPGEVMDIVLHGDTVGELYEVYSVIGQEAVISLDVEIQESGTAKVTYEIPDVSDGIYTIRVKRPNGAVEAEASFTVQGYSLNIETDRDSYLSGDVLKVFWTANNLEDQTLPASGVGKITIWSQDTDNASIVMPLLATHTFTNATGSVSFTLPDPVNYSKHYFVDAWFNDSEVSPKRSQYSRAYFSIRRLGVIISLDKGQYTAGSLLRVSVRTLATNNTANPSLADTPEPGCAVSISIKKLGTVSNTDSIMGLVTDSHGLVEYILALNNPAYVDGATFDLEVFASKGSNSAADSVSFEISTSSSISVVLDFNRIQYASGETLFVNATASSIGGEAAAGFTYIIEIRDGNANGTLFAINTQSQGDFSFRIPEDFQGPLWVKVTADDGAGHSASAVQQVSVSYAIVLVNVNRENYNAGDILTITYEVVGSMKTEPDTFYVVYDKEGSVVDEGAVYNGSFEFTVPEAPSDRYVFTVLASAEGRIISGSDSADLFSGYVLLLNFNRAAYEPGDTMAIDYRIIVMGNADMPKTFTISYGLVNGPEASLQTDKESGTIMYSIPMSIDQGEQVFMASCDFGASASELVVVKAGANLLWYLTVKDIPLFSVLLFVLVLLSLYVTYRTRKRVKRLQAEGLEISDSASPRRTQEAPGQTVNCAECGNPIEITTSRRPIEVMCPHCGEIQHIEK